MLKPTNSTHIHTEFNAKETHLTRSRNLSIFTTASSSLSEETKVKTKGEASYYKAKSAGIDIVTI